MPRSNSTATPAGETEGRGPTDVDNWRYQRDSARAGLEAAEAQRDLAKLDLGYTKVDGAL